MKNYKRQIKQCVKVMLGFLPGSMQEPLEAFARKLLNGYRAFKAPIYPKKEEERCVDLMFEFLTKARLEISKIDSSLHPRIQPQPYEYCPNLRESAIGKKFITACKELDRGYDIIYVVPWLRSGGADLYCVNAANIMAAKGMSVLVITTENSDSTWSSKLQSNIRIYELGKCLKTFAFCEQTEFFARLLVQIKTKRVHIINSHLALEATSVYKKYLQKNTEIYVSFFSNDILDNGGEVGYINSYLTVLDDAVVSYSTDNKLTPLYYEKKYGVNANRWSVVYNYIEKLSEEFRPHLGAKVLWAGRLDKHKRPELLLEIIKRMPEVQFEIYGTSVLNDVPVSILKEIKEQNNSVLRGSYDGFSSIPLEQFGCLLFTSTNEGLPNILIEAALAGLPIVGSNVGGVGDLLSETTGFPISGDTDAYIEAIRYVLNNKETAKLKARNAYELASARHSKNNMTKGLLHLYKTF